MYDRLTIFEDHLIRDLNAGRFADGVSLVGTWAVWCDAALAGLCLKGSCVGCRLQGPASWWGRAMKHG